MKQINVNRNETGKSDKNRLAKKIIETVLWIIVGVFLPIVSIVLWIPRLCHLVIKHRGERRLYKWLMSIFLVIMNLLWAILILLAVAAAMFVSPSPSISRENVGAAEYGSPEKLYELTGVSFPDITPVDSLQYNMYGVDPVEWTEHKYVLSDGIDEEFYKVLEEACVSDSEHWEITDYIVPYFYTGQKIGGEGKIYHYERATPPETGKSYFISVDVQNDTIWLRKGYICY